MAKGAFVKSLIEIAEKAGKLDMSEAARLRRAKDQGYNVDDLYTHAGGEISEIKKGGYPNLFDGVFASPGESSLHSGGKQTSFVFKRPIAGEGDIDLDYDKAITTIKKEYPDINDDELEAMLELSAADKNIFDANINPFERFGFDDLGEASWEAQRVRGRIAADQNFDAIAMNDEHGVSYLIPSGSKARSIDAAFDPVKKDLANIMASAAPVAAGLGGMAALSSPDQASASEAQPDSALASVGLTPSGNEIKPGKFASKLIQDSIKYGSTYGQRIEPTENKTLANLADKAGKYNKWRKENVHPVADMALPVGELPEDLLRKAAYGDKIKYMDILMAELGLM